MLARSRRRHPAYLTQYASIYNYDIKLSTMYPCDSALRQHIIANICSLLTMARRVLPTCQLFTRDEKPNLAVWGRCKGGPCVGGGRAGLCWGRILRLGCLLGKSGRLRIDSGQTTDYPAPHITRYCSPCPPGTNILHDSWHTACPQHNANLCHYYN